MPRVSSLLFLAVLSVAPLAPAAPHQTGEELYRAACATCHGRDGQGSPVRAVAFDVPLPDLTDCSFATREGDPDWLAVVHDGGPARAFAREMPAFGVALDQRQLQSVLDHVRGFCSERGWPRGELNLPQPFATEKAYPEDEVVASSATAIDGPGATSNKLVCEQRIGARSQFELIVPFGWREQPRSGTDAAWSGGVGDVALGFPHVLHHSLPCSDDHRRVWPWRSEFFAPTRCRTSLPSATSS